jgi:hypothetical protein
LRTRSPSAAPPRVDREAGHGVIRGASLLTAGPAEGHGFDIDATTIAQAVALAGGRPGRWTHGNLCADGLGTHLGRWRNVRGAGRRVVGDFHFSPSAHKVKPEGLSVDAPTYLMDLAETEPEVVGVSAVIDFDLEELAAGDDDGPPRRVARLRNVVRADFVADPAANPDGLFAGTPSELAADATEALLEAEELYGRGRVRRFLRSYLRDDGGARMTALQDRRPPLETQSLVFDKERFSRAEAVAWAREHDYKADKVDETEESWRLRQRDPGDFVEDSFRTVELDDGVQAVMGHLKERSSSEDEAPEGDEEDAMATKDEQLKAQAETIAQLKATVASLEAREQERRQEARQAIVDGVLRRCAEANVAPPEKEEQERMLKALELDAEIGREFADAVLARCLATAEGAVGQLRSLEPEQTAERGKRRLFAAAGFQDDDQPAAPLSRPRWR